MSNNSDQFQNIKKEIISPKLFKSKKSDIYKFIHSCIQNLDDLKNRKD